ncbi:MAG: glycoside hydrolase family 38 C-terminal domain-containing protein [bacterium]
MKTDVSVSPSTLENASFRVTLDPKSGDVVSFYDKRHKRELFEPGKAGNRIQLFDDRPTAHDAWNIAIGDEKYLDRVGDAEIVESGPVRVTLKVSKQFNISKFNHYLSLYENYPQFEGRIDVDWQERRVIAKLAFPLNLSSESAWFEIPYAAIERRSVPRTLAEQAKWEVSAQKWVDYTDASGAFGVSLLNNSKYGYDVKRNVLRMTLLRSPVSPDPVADRGAHSIPYALYPHPGDWRDADTPRRGFEFNYPLIPWLAHPHPGRLPKEKSFFAAEPSNVILTVVKKAEDSSRLVLRVFEAAGRDTTATITLPATPKSVVETNLLEEKIADVGFQGPKITVPVSHFEIKSFKVAF